MSDRELVGDVVVHLPDLFVRACELDVVDLRFGGALAASAEAEDNLVGEPMSDLARRIVACVLVVLLGEYLWILEVFGVEEEAVADDLAALNAEVAEGDHRGGGWRVCPLLDLDFGGGAWIGLWQKTFGDDVE